MDTPNDGIDYKKKYEHLESMVRDMIDAQQAYFKSNKDYQLLKVSKAIEAEVKELVNPKPKKISQATIDWLGQ